jgi:hypothetical protein
MREPIFGEMNSVKLWEFGGPSSSGFDDLEEFAQQIALFLKAAQSDAGFDEDRILAFKAAQLVVTPPEAVAISRAWLRDQVNDPEGQKIVASWYANDDRRFESHDLGTLLSEHQAKKIEEDESLRGRSMNDFIPCSPRAQAALALREQANAHVTFQDTILGRKLAKQREKNAYQATKDCFSC